jgi:hypothetical protein
MAAQRSVRVRTTAFLRNALILANARSIGLKSGPQGGRKRNSAPARSVATEPPAAYRPADCPSDDVSRPKGRKEGALDVCQEGSTVHSPSSVIGELTPDNWSAPADVAVFQYPFRGG